MHAVVSDSTQPQRSVLLIQESAGTALISTIEAAGFPALVLSGLDDVSEVGWRNDPLLLLIHVTHSRQAIELCSRLRTLAPFSETPIVVLQREASEAEKIQVLEAGADDLLREPISARELSSRLRAVLRSRSLRAPEDILIAGPLAVDTTSMQVLLAGEVVPLSITEYRLLLFFLHHQNRVLSRERILEGAWREPQQIRARAVDVYVRRLRSKIESGHGHYIKTIRGAGYVFAYAART